MLSFGSKAIEGAVSDGAGAAILAWTFNGKSRQKSKVPAAKKRTMRFIFFTSGTKQTSSAHHPQGINTVFPKYPLCILIYAFAAYQYGNCRRTGNGGACQYPSQGLLCAYLFAFGKNGLPYA